MNIRKQCLECGSIDVKVDAWAIWNIEKQEWVLSDYYPNNAYCEYCDGACNIIDVPLEE